MWEHNPAQQTFRDSVVQRISQSQGLQRYSPETPQGAPSSTQHGCYRASARLGAAGSTAGRQAREASRPGPARTAEGARPFPWQRLPARRPLHDPRRIGREGPEQRQGWKGASLPRAGSPPTAPGTPRPPDNSPRHVLSSPAPAAGSASAAHAEKMAAPGSLLAPHRSAAALPGGLGERGSAAPAVRGRHPVAAGGQRLTPQRLPAVPPAPCGLCPWNAREWSGRRAPSALASPQDGCQHFPLGTGQAWCSRAAERWCEGVVISSGIRGVSYNGCTKALRSNLPGAALWGTLWIWEVPAELLANLARSLPFFFPFRFCSHQLLNSLYFMYLYSNILVHTETSG